MGTPVRRGACPRNVALATNDVISVIILTQEQESGLAVGRKHEVVHGEIATIVWN